MHAIAVQIERALAQGELLSAFDLASRTLAERADDPRLLYFRALALARMGESEAALTEIERSLSTQTDEDSLALRGRVLKDMALRRPDSRDREELLRASDAYLAAHRATGGYFSLINAATLSCLAGHRDRAEELAEQVLANPHVRAGDSFFARATAGEAFVLLGDPRRADMILTEAIGLPDATLAARASAGRQIGLLADFLASAALHDLSEKLRPPPVIFFSGHMFRPDRAAEGRILDGIRAELSRTSACVAFGAAAAGADILIGEEIIARGGELNLVLPFAAEDFVRYSVLPYGDQWLPRYEAMLASANSVSFATNASYVGDAGQFDYGNQVAMGLACLRAQHLDTTAMQLAVQDGGDDVAPGGTASATALWRRTGRPVVTIPSGALDRNAQDGNTPATTGNVREPRSIIFGDFAGFSRIDERRLPAFLEQVMGRIAAVLATKADEILFRNTWGDAVFVIVSTPTIAAELALELSECLVAPGLEEFMSPTEPGMRIGLHHGPVMQAFDPVTGRPGYFGSEVTRAARLEPVTPAGKVYATQSFAAMLALTADHAFRCRYVGHVPLAKDYGTFPMHLLARREIA